MDAKTLEWNIGVSTLVICVVAMATALDDQTPRKSYHGDSVLKVEVPNEHVWDTVKDIISLLHDEEPHCLEVWRPPSLHRMSTDVHVTHGSVNRFTQHLQRRNITHAVTIDDVQRLIEEQHHTHRGKRDVRHHHNNVVGSYATFEEIISWLGSLQKKHHPHVSLQTIGQTYEGRNMTVIKIGIPGESLKPAVWLDAGFHAREWITQSTAVYIIHKLIQGLHDESSEAHWLLTYLDFYVLPVANPDGYVYTFTKDRLWRKNRRPISRQCNGVDINRNFRFQWGQGHTSDDPCSIMYRGAQPETELETQHIVNFFQQQQQQQSRNVLAYVTLHSYMQHFYTRYDYAPGHYPNDHETLLSLAERAADAMSAENGSLYHVGTAADILYSYGGGSADWAKAVAGVKYSYLIELRDGGMHGFLLPPDQILPTGQETWAGLHTIAKELIYTHARATEKTEEENSIEQNRDVRDEDTYPNTYSSKPAELEAIPLVKSSSGRATTLTWCLLFIVILLQVNSLC